ncbi:MAG: TRAP transporter large permease subunit, partial [Kiloniellales bacterium]|nr:TRAP transporter large permease subunit [Kiloniellales bacterium]
LAPSIVEAGIPALSAHLFVFYFGLMSLIKPPVAIAAFTAATVANGHSLKTALAAVRVGWIAYFIPFLIITSPVFIMQGSWLHIGLSFGTALVGIWLVTAAIVGCAATALSPSSRAIYVLGGVLMLVPTDVGMISLVANLAGPVVGLAAVLIGRRSHLGAEEASRLEA